MRVQKLKGGGSSGRGASTAPLPALQSHMAMERVRRMRALTDLFDAGEWRGVVLDVHHLVSDGWADQALLLGWDVRELFGVGHEYDGLACWLCDRRVAVLSEDGAICLGYDRSRSFYRRVDPANLVLLWEWPQ